MERGAMLQQGISLLGRLAALDANATSTTTATKPKEEDPWTEEDVHSSVVATRQVVLKAKRERERSEQYPHGGASDSYHVHYPDGGEGGERTPYDKSRGGKKHNTWSALDAKKEWLKKELEKVEMQEEEKSGYKPKYHENQYHEYEVEGRYTSGSGGKWAATTSKASPPTKAAKPVGFGMGYDDDEHEERPPTPPVPPSRKKRELQTPSQSPKRRPRGEFLHEGEGTAQGKRFVSDREDEGDKTGQDDGHKYKQDKGKGGKYSGVYGKSKGKGKHGKYGKYGKSKGKGKHGKYGKKEGGQEQGYEAYDELAKYDRLVRRIAGLVRYWSEDLEHTEDGWCEVAEVARATGVDFETVVYILEESTDDYEAERYEMAWLPTHDGYEEVLAVRAIGKHGWKATSGGKGH